MAISRQTWANVLFIFVAAIVATLTVQQWIGIGGLGGERFSRTLAFIIPMAFPVGIAWWGKKTGQVGPALGALSLIVLLWTGLVLTPGE